MTFIGPHRRIRVEPMRDLPRPPREPSRPSERPAPAPKRKPEKVPA